MDIHRSYGSKTQIHGCATPPTTHATRSYLYAVPGKYGERLLDPCQTTLDFFFPRPKHKSLAIAGSHSIGSLSNAKHELFHEFRNQSLAPLRMSFSLTRTPFQSDARWTKRQ